jgi:hypothetical protein
VGLERAHWGRSGAMGSGGAAGMAEEEQRRSGTRKKKERRMGADRWDRAVRGRGSDRGNDSEGNGND